MPETQEWDVQLPHVLFAYQSLTGQSLFSLVYGHEPRLPTETMFSPPVRRETMALDDYASQMPRKHGRSLGACLEQYIDSTEEAEKAAQ